MMIGCLIIHGYTGSPYEVEPLATYLKEHTDWDIKVPTLPGHGEELDLEDVAYEKWLNKAEEALEQLKESHDTIYLIGFSMGGMIASYLAATYEIDKLVLLATAGKYISLKQLRTNLGEVISDSFKGALSSNSLVEQYKSKKGEIPFKANLEFLKLVRHTRKHLKDIDTPVLIVHGRQDQVVPPETIDYLNKEIPSEEKELVLFERSDHLICLGEDKDILNDMVYEFLALTKW